MTGKAHLVGVLAVLALCLAVIGLLLAGDVLTYAARHEIGSAPTDLPIHPVTLRGHDGQVVAGWWVPGRTGAGAVLLLHGIRSDRRQMIGRARFLHRLGYHALLVDLPGHGESSGDRITFGLNESTGVALALGYLATVVPQERTGVIGVSIGAAATVLLKAPPHLAVVVLESMYPTIEDAAIDRLRLHLGPAAVPLAPLLIWQLPLRLGIPVTALRPIDALPALRAPVLIAAGTRDRHTTWSETLALFERAREPKALWAVAGAAHEDLYAFDPAVYEATVSTFLAQHLREGAR